MKIEIVTTKKKLSISYIKQMFWATLEELKQSECLGKIHLNSQLKELYPILLLKLQNGEYRITSTGWQLGKQSVYRKKPKFYTTAKKFKTDEEAIKFHNIIKKFTEESEQIYI